MTFNEWIEDLNELEDLTDLEDFESFYEDFLIEEIYNDLINY